MDTTRGMVVGRASSLPGGAPCAPRGEPWPVAGLLGVGLFDEESFQHGAAPGVHGDLGGQAAVADGILVAASLSLLDEEGFDSVFDPVRGRVAPLEEGGGGRSVCGESGCLPMDAVGFGFQHGVDGPSTEFVPGGLEPGHLVGGHDTEGVAEDDVIAAEEVARVDGFNAEEDGLATEEDRGFEGDHACQDEDLEGDGTEEDLGFGVLEPSPGLGQRSGTGFGGGGGSGGGVGTWFRHGGLAFVGARTGPRRRERRRR